MRKLCGIHFWKDGPRTVKDWKPVSKKAKVLIERSETSEEYHARKKNMVTLLLFGIDHTMMYRRR